MTLTNFSFLYLAWTDLWPEAKEAERMGLRAPRTTAFYARRTLELTVRWVYENDVSVSKPYEDTLSALIHHESFRKLLPLGLFEHIKYVWKLGNQAVHETRTIKPEESVEALRSLHNFLKWFASTYTEGGVEVPEFDASLIPDPKKIKELAEAKVAATMEQIQMLQASLAEKDEAKAASEALHAKAAEEIASLRAELQRIKAANEAKVKTLTFSEAENRAHLIDPLLRESGWNPDATNVREYEVSGMPNAEGKGYVDYVLWGKDGLPLAVVEAKKTQVEPEMGKHQAKLYADCLEQMTGRRPLIYFTNGYRTWFWDDKQYPPRSVSGFHSLDELQLMANRRTSQGDLIKSTPKAEIVERPYQRIAIGRVGETFQQEHRRGALLAMATGTGKTRTTIALVDLLMRNNWVRRVLFLADRRALLLQAEREFKKFLPETSRGSLLDGNVPDDCRILFSTYPTMMNAIDQWREDGTRRFGPGHFDLLVVDEAHRSVYQKYRAIFEYFDSLLLGLTATPKNEVDHNTYELFGLEPGIPTHAYELDDAVKEGYLVPPKAKSYPLKFLREGIKYEELSDEEKAEYEEKFGLGEEEMPEEIDPAALNSWLFNTDTVDKVLENLMKDGIKVDGGDKLGKTIIFAKNHKHAQFIVERFDKAYPHLKGHFCQLIDNKVVYAQDLIDNFSVPENQPTIAVSVDMLDTGIDVPEVVNLVFFKMVRSKTKFWQMVGRGTRLRKDLFGPGEHKTHFLIFDYLGNLEFFTLNPKGIEGTVPKSVREQTIQARVDLLKSIAGIEDIEEYRDNLKEGLFLHVQALNPESFTVRPHEEIITPFRIREKFDQLTEEDLHTLSHKIAPIYATEEEHEITRRFDLLMLKLELSVLNKTKAQEELSNRLRDIAQNLTEKSSVPAIASQMQLLLEIQTDTYWQDITLPMLDSARIRLRDLVKFADQESGKQRVFVHFQDELGEGTEFVLTKNDPSLHQYRERLKHYLKDNVDHPSVQKIRNNEPLMTSDVEAIEQMLFGDGIVKPDQLETVIGEDGPLTLFIRKTVGLEKEAAKRAFHELFAANGLSAKQLLFLNQLIEILSLNGVMNPGDLFEPPFTHQHDLGVDGIFPEQAAKIVKIIEQINSSCNISRE